MALRALHLGAACETGLPVHGVRGSVVLACHPQLESVTLVPRVQLVCAASIDLEAGGQVEPWQEPGLMWPGAVLALELAALYAS